MSGGGGAGGRAREALRHSSEGLKRGSERARVMISHTLGEPALFAITLSTAVAAIFFSLGVVAAGSRRASWPTLDGHHGRRQLGVVVDGGPCPERCGRRRFQGPIPIASSFRW